MPVCSAALGLALASALGAGAEKSPEVALELAAARAVTEAYGTLRAEAPQRDPALDRAARSLATLALERDLREAIESGEVGAQISRAGAWDPAPRALVKRGTSASRVAQAFAAADGLAALPATHFGAGADCRGDRAAAVLLMSERRAELSPFPRAVAPGSTSPLCGRLAFPLYGARAIVTGPAGVFRPQMQPSDRRNRFCAEVEFGAPGRYTVEVEASSAKGPEVVALFRVQAGASPAGELASAGGPAPELADRAKAEAQVLAAVNGRRRGAGLRDLARSALLDSVAADHSREMASLNYFAHVSPLSGDPGERLRAAGFAWARVAENLAEAESALAAERMIESSPGHLANVLDPEVTLAGIGTAQVARGALNHVILTVLFARPP